MHVHTRVGAALGALVLTFGVAGIGLASSLRELGTDRPTLGAQGCGIVPLDVELIIDASGSMGTNSSGSPAHTRMYWAQQAAGQLVDSLNTTGGVGGAGIHHVGVTRFSGATSSVALALGTSSATNVKAAVDSLTATGNTPLKTGMATGAADMNANARNAVGGIVQRVIIFLTDGRPNPDGPTNGSYATSNGSQRPTLANATSFLGSADIVYSIAVGTGGSSGAQVVDLGLMQLLDKPNGHYYNVVDASNLGSLFADIFTEISCPPHVVVTKGVDKATADPGDTLNYTISLSNDGGADATGVDVHDDISALLAHGTFGACDHGCTHDSDSVDWSNLSIPIGGSLDLHMSIDLGSTGWTVGTTHLRNTVVIASTNCSADTQDRDCSTDTTVEVEPTITAPPITAPPVTAPPVTAPPVTAPPVTAPPITASPVTAPPVTAPPVTEAPRATPAFTQAVAAVTNIPTLPSTETVADGSTTAPPSSAAWLLIVALGVLLGTIVVLTPAPVRRRR
jgi:uncharacterized repeat protein (TIGR01451 family)